MSLEVEATYEGGVLKLDKPLPIDEHERVTIQVKMPAHPIWQNAGVLRWTGDPEVLRLIAEDPELRAPELL